MVTLNHKWNKRVSIKVQSAGNRNINEVAMKNQQGVVLIVSLVFLIALTAVASALMLNTTSDLKMSGASEEKVIANQDVVSAIDELIFAQVTAPTGGNDFAIPLPVFKAAEGGGCENIGENELTEVDGECVIDAKDEFDDTNKDSGITSATIGMGDNQYGLETDCPHSTNPSSTGVFSCNVLRIQVNKQYGSRSVSLVQANSGIAQQLLR
jgi:hypothetical protein